MGKIDELIKQFCPDGVKSAKLGDICNILDSKRKPITKGKRIRGNCPYYGANGIQDYVDGYLFDGIYLLLGEDGSVINNDKSPVLNWAVGKIWVNNHAHILSEKKEDALLRYLYYALQTCDVSSIVRGTPPKINQANLRNIEIPLPPLAVQKEIVEILDTFTGMIDNLQKELEQRQKQFEYYCESLVGSAKGEVKTLGEIGRMERGTGLQKSDFRDTGIPCIHYGQIHTYYGTVATETKSFCSEELAKKLRKAKPGDLLIATTSEDVEACCKATVWLGEGEVAYSGDSFKFSHNQNPKYIAYLFKTEAFSKQKRLCATGAKVVRVSGAAMEKFKFSFPSLETQQEIVDKLDTFEALISNIKQEIELRQKQYEYYREKLLTFE